MQEFSFAHSNTKTKINDIFNSHFTGSVLWNLFGKEAEMIYNTWSTSIRKMFRLDRKTHRYLIEPVSKTQHIKLALMKRFINFTEKLSCSRKCATRNIFHTIINDCRSTSGMNLRRIMLECGKSRIREATSKSVGENPFHPVPLGEEWRINLVEELMEMRDDLPNSVWNKNEISLTLDYVCTT